MRLCSIICFIFMIIGCLNQEIESSFETFDHPLLVNPDFENVHPEELLSFSNKHFNNNFNDTINYQINNRKSKSKASFPPLLPMLLMGKYMTTKKPNLVSKILKGSQNQKDTNEDEDNLFNSLVTFLRSNIAAGVINNSNITETCRNNLNDAYVNNSTTFYFLKIIIDSTKNKNDVGSFQDCIFNSYGDGTEEMLQKLEYVVVNINKDNREKKNNTFFEKQGIPSVNDYENGFFIFGMCIVKGCNEDEITEILINGNAQINVLDNFEKDEAKVFCLGKNVFEFNQKDLLYLTPLLFVLFQILFTLFPSVPAKLITWCVFKTRRVIPDNSQNNIIRNNNNNNNLKLSESNDILTTNNQTNNNNNNTFGDLSNPGNNILITKNSNNKNNNSNDSPKSAPNLGEKYKNNIKKVEKLFSLLRNIQDLFLINFTKENIKPTYDFSSIGYVIGIRGIAMFSIIIGYVYLILFESPIKIYCKDSYFKLIKSTLYNIIATGIRMSPRILFACSGYCLAFKILIYFDKKMKLINEGGSEDRFFDEQNFIYCEDNLNNERRLTNRDNSAPNQEKVLSAVHKLPFKYLFSFLMKQFHKYLLYVFALIFFKFCLYTLFSYIGQIGPMWVFFKKYVIDRFTNTHLLLQILLIDTIADVQDTEKSFRFLFWIMGLEIKFFILTSLIFYIAYRRNNRLDILIIIFIPLVMILKVAFYFFMFYYSSVEFLPTIYYKSNLYGFVSITPLYNYNFYLIGVIFGAMNYIHQKSLTLDDIRSTGKSYLIIPCKLYNLFLKFHNSRKKSPKFLMILIVLIGLFIAFSQKIFLLFIKLNQLSDLNDNYFKDHFFNCFYLVDVEIFIFLLFLVCSGISRSENNFFFNILKSNYWIFKNKIYFGFILMMNPLICYIFYQSESRVRIEFFNVLFLSIVCYMNLFIYSSLYYIFFDAPFKKLNRYFLKLK